MKYILVADDEPLNQSIFKEMLSDDYKVEIVEDGVACLESVSKKVPDLLLLDIAMPNKDGIEVCRALRERKETENLPIILVSAYASNVDRETGMEAGATDYVSKPFDIGQFFIKIQTILGE